MTNLYDLEDGRVLGVVRGRTEYDSKQLIMQALADEQREQVTAVALGMWQAYANPVNDKRPQAEIAHDRFHVSHYLNHTVDRVASREKSPYQAGRRPPEGKPVLLTDQ